MSFPTDKEISDLLKSLKQNQAGFVLDVDNASKSDVLKYRLCQEFLKYMKKESLTQAQLAKELGVDRSIVNKIVLHRIEHFTIDRLIDLLSRVCSFEIVVA